MTLHSFSRNNQLPIGAAGSGSSRDNPAIGPKTDLDGGPVCPYICQSSPLQLPILYTNMAQTHNILVLEGDGCGPEVMREAVKVLKALETAQHQFKLRRELIGGCSIDATGKPVTDEVKQAALDSDAVLFAAVGGPKWDNARRGLDGPEGGLLQLRKAMDIYANLRPCSASSPSTSIAKEFSPFRSEVIEGVDFVVVRENCGGAYFGKKVEDPTYGTLSSCAVRIDWLTRSI